ncbi:MAG: lysophospholipase [Actinomycetota bacterium]
MEHREGHIEGGGGLELYRQAWLPDSDRRATVVIAHGAGEHSTRYDGVARGLVGAGYAVHALDHRGHGRSEGKRARIDDVDEAAADLRALIALARGETDGTPLLLLGHSMGAMISLVYACESQQEIDGLLLSGVTAVLDNASPLERGLSKLLSAVAPGVGIYGVETDAVSRDPRVVLDYETDPLVHHGKLSARTVASLTGAVESFPERVPNLTLPLLVMHGGADRIAPPEGSRLVHGWASSQDKDLRIYNGLYHEILFEPEGDRVLADVVAWLDERV